MEEIVTFDYKDGDVLCTAKGYTYKITKQDAWVPHAGFVEIVHEARLGYVVLCWQQLKTSSKVFFSIVSGKERTFPLLSAEIIYLYPASRDVLAVS